MTVPDDFRLSDVPFNVVQREVSLCRQIQLRVQMYNQVFADIVYASKLMCFAMIIPGTSFAIRYHVTKPVASLVNSFYGPCVSFYFLCMYDKAFRIPDEVEKVKRMVGLKLDPTHRTLFCSDMEKREMRQRIKSIPFVGVKQQSFGYLERATTLIFFDFVVSSICSVLVSSE